MKNTSLKCMNRAISFMVAFAVFAGSQIQLVFAENSSDAYKIEVVLAPTVDKLYTPQDGMIPFQQNGKLGWLNENFEEVIPAEYESEYSGSSTPSKFSEGFAVVRRGGYAGMIDKAGTVVIPFEYDNISSFHNGFAVVYKGRYKGLVDTAGNIVVPVEYDDIKDFSDGRAVVSKWDENSNRVVRGAVNESGELVVPMEYNACDSFQDGFSIVSKPGEYQRNEGVIDRDGTVLLPLEYSGIRRAGKGVIASKTTEGETRKSYWLIENGEAVCAGEYYEIDTSFTNGLMGVREQDGSWGFIDIEGNLVAPAIYEEATAFNEKLICVKQDGLWGFIDAAGNAITPAIYEEVWGASRNLTAAKQGGKWGFIDESGNLIVPAVYDAVMVFSEGLACVQQNGKWGYIDTAGEVAIPFEFDDNINTYNYSSSFRNGFANITKDGNRVTIDKSGEIKFPFYLDIFERERLQRDGVTCVTQEGSCAIINENGELLTGFWFLSVEDFHDGYAFFTDFEGDYGIVSQSGEVTAQDVTWSPVYNTYSLHGSANEVLAKKETRVTYFSEGLAAVRVDDKWGYINPAGEFVIAPQFDTATENLGYGHHGERPGGENFSEEGYAKVHMDGRWCIIDRYGNFMLDDFYDPIQSNTNYYICKNENGDIKILTKNCHTVVYGANGTLMDTNGNAILQYDNSIDFYKDNLFTYKLNGKTGLFSISQKALQGEEEICVYCDGQLVEFDQPPILVNDRVLVPIRAIFEAMGAEIIWEADTKTVIAKKGDNMLSLQVGSETMTKNGQAITLDVSPQIVHDRTLVPVRAVSEGLNADVQWDEESRTVTIVSL